MKLRFSDGLKAALLLCWPLISAAAPRVATSDWTIAETLQAMGHTPVSVADRRVYDQWVNYPPLPASAREAGLRFKPNLERLHQIKPDFFVQSKWYAAAKPQFEKIAPVHEIDFAGEKGITYAHTVETTRRLGKLVNDAAAAERLILATEQKLTQAKQQLAPWRKRPLAVVQFADGRHLRIFGQGSLYQPVFDKLGLKNAWSGSVNSWGFENIGLVDLGKLPPNTLLIIVKPHPLNTRTVLEKSTLWQRLPFSKPANRRVLATTWSYGALPAMQHFAAQLVQQLPSEQEPSW